MRPLRYSINVTLDGCCDHRAIPADEALHRHAAENLAHLERLLAGEGTEAHEAAVAINAGALAWVFGAADDLAAGTALAREALRGGRCLDRLKKLAELSHGA